MKAAILTDLTRCIGCESCVWACKEANGLSRADGAKKLSDTTYTTLERKGNVNVRRQCMHCEEPACVSVCPVGALQKSASGAVTYDANKCMGCRYCMIACPFGIPKYEWQSVAPKVQKCTMCSERMGKGAKEPACTSVCPTGATVFGDRDALLREATRRIEAEPNRYVQHIFGQREAGGTSVIYLSGVPFEQLGFKTHVQMDPYPRLTWQVLSKLPNVVSVAGVGLLGVWWIIRRRDELGHKPHDHGASDHQPPLPEARGKDETK